MQKEIVIHQRRHLHIAKYVDNVLSEMITNGEDISATTFILDRLGKKTIVYGNDIWAFVSLNFFKNMIKFKYITINVNKHEGNRSNQQQ
jgi:hypothetical protein